MKIAIIGAGLAGLSLAYFLSASKAVHVTVFEAEKVGAGASGVCSGLLHPYPGLSARRSSRADEALLAAHELLQIAQGYQELPLYMQGGILRKALNEEQNSRLLSHVGQWKDVEKTEKEGLFLIQSGLTVFSSLYLEGLFKVCLAQGVEFIFQKITALEALKEFDQKVIAAGWGVREFQECNFLPLKFLKGQTLCMKGAPPYKQSLISKGYIALKGEDAFEIGSTYEREFSNDIPCLETATQLLRDKLDAFGGEILECRAAVRVMAKESPLPLIRKLNATTYVFTALGSRGLLYHALFGKELSRILYGS